MSVYHWTLIAAAVVFLLAMTKRPFRIFVLYLLPFAAIWLVAALGMVEDKATPILLLAAVLGDILIWAVRRRSKAQKRQRFELGVPRETV